MSTFSSAVKVGLHLFGIKPYARSTIPARLYWILIMTTSQFFQYKYIIVNIHTDDIFIIMDAMSTALTWTLFYIKLIILWSKERTIFDLLQMMDTDWRNNTLKNHDCMRIMTNTANIAHRASRWIISMQIASASFYSLGVIVFNLTDPEKQQPVSRDTILRMEFPFEINTNFIYVTVSFIQFYNLMLLAFGITIVNSLIATMVLHVCGQIDVLRECLLRSFSKSEIQSIDDMASLIIKHEEIITFSKKIEDLFTYVAFMILFSDTLIICCLGYIIVTSVGAPNGETIILKCMIFYISINFETFVFCYCGEHLSVKSRTIGDAAYNSLWYDVMAKESRIVLFIIMRSQKQLVITSGKIVDLCLERFTSVVKASASYVSVLLAAY